MKKIINTLAVGAAIATMGVASAQAATLDSVAGNIKFLYDGFDAAQASYSVDCSTEAACDSSSASAWATGANQANDTFGYASVSGIKNIGGFSNLWNAGDDGDFLFAYFHGFNDYKVDGVGTGSTDIYSTGGNVDIYRVDSTFMTTYYNTFADQDDIESALVGLTAYLELEFVPGCDAIETSATLCGTFDLSTLHGDSVGFAKAVGGTALAKYPDDFRFEQSVKPCTLSFCDPSSSFNVDVESSSATTRALPEPGALGLLGLGLVGLGLVARRRKA
jgi:hypothetical protein